MTDVQDLAAYLTSKGEKVHRASGREVTVHCFFCADGDVKGKGKLYLNIESWLYDCKRCGAQGNRKTLLEHFGDEDELQHVAGEDPMTRRRILAEAAALAHEMLLANEPMLEYLLGRGLTPETIVRKQYGYVPKNVGISRMLPCRESVKAVDLIKAGLITLGGQEFFNHSIVIPYWSHGSIVQLREKKVDGKYRTAGGDIARLYNADSLRGADQVIVTEGEFDCDMLEQTLLDSGVTDLARTAVVGLPGAGSWPDDFFDSLAGVRRVFAGFDPDDTGRKFAVKLKDELGSKVRVLNLPDALPKCDWNDFLKPRDKDTNPHGGHDWRDVQQMLIEADLEGKRMFTVADAAAKWVKQRNEAPGIKLGWTSLDAILRPGLKPGQLLIPLAKTGCIHGGADMVVNRGGKSFHITLADLVHMQNGGGRGKGGSKTWDLSIPTRVQREVDGQVRLGTIKHAWFSGDKQTYTVTTETGRTIRATDEHPFLTERGWLRLDQLQVGDLVHVRGERSARGRRKINYRQVCGLNAHPHAAKPGAVTAGRYPYHRLVAEATLNGLDVDSFIAEVRAGRVTQLRFLDPAQWAVHHVDHDPSNNEPGNLKVLTHSEHAALHATEGTTRNVQIPIAHERVVSVEPYGIEPTYDIEVEDDPHNFIADGFVVHNTGKTVWLSNVAHNIRQRRVLIVSLEMTAAEVFEHFRRIHHFHFPTATPAERDRDYVNIRIVDQNRLGKGDLRDLIREYTEDVGAKPEVVTVDYLQYFARGFPGGGQYEKTSDAVMELKAVAKEESLAIICPSQVSRSGEDGKPLSLDDARDSGVVEETGDFVLSLFRPDQITNKQDPTGAMPVQTGAFNAQLLKSRHGGKGRQFTFRMSLMSLAICDSLDRKNIQRIEQENSLVRGGTHYDDFRQDTNARVAQTAIDDPDAQGALLP